MLYPRVCSLIVLFTFLVVPRIAQALTVTISNVPSTVTDQVFDINVVVNGAQPATNYIRALFYPLNTYHYFGYTFNGSDFVNSSDYTHYLPITIDSSGNWSGVIQAKIDLLSSYFLGSGSDYGFKIRRYTGGGSPTDSEEYIVTFAAQTSSSISPTPTPSATSSPTPSSTPTPTATPTPSPSSSFTISNIPSQITTDQSFTAKVELTISGNPNTVYYLKGAFKKTGGTRYFGLTKKDGNWIEYGDDYSEQYQITTDHNSSWSGNLEIKPDIYDKDYKGSGDYIFKVGRLTVSGSSPTWSNEAAIKLNNGADETTIPTSGTSSAAPPIETSLDSSSAVLAAESEYVVSSDSSDIAPTSSEEATPVKVAGEKTNKPNYIVIIGSVLVFSGIGSITYLYFKNKVKF